MSLSIEVMDSHAGRAATGVWVALLQETDAQWQELAAAHTDLAGRFCTTGSPVGRGRYRLTLDLDQYFAGFGVTPFQAQFDVVFRIFHEGDHVRMLLLVTSSSCSAHMVLSEASA